MHRKTPLDYNNGWKNVGTSMTAEQYGLLDLVADVADISKSAIIRSLLKSYIDGVVGIDQDPATAREQWQNQTPERRSKIRKDALEKLASIKAHLLGENA